MKVTLRRKVQGLIGVIVLLTAVVITAVSAVSIVRRADEKTAIYYKETLLSERKAQIKGYVDMAARLIENLPLEEAKKTIRGMRYADKGYLWIQDYNNVFLTYVDAAEEGKNQTNRVDPAGRHIIDELTTLARDKGEGFLSYLGYVPGQQDRRPKISYVKGMPERGWIVISGLYIDDIDKAVAEQQARTRHDAAVTIALQLCVALGVAALMMVAATFLLKRYITGPLENISQVMKDFNNDLTIAIPVASDDEVGDLAGWLNQHIASLNTNIRMVAEVTEGLNSHSGAISGVIGQQNSFAAHLSSSVAEMTSTMEELSASAGQIAHHSQAVVDRADKTLADTRNGAAEVSALTVEIHDINGNVQANMAEIVELGRRSKEITRIMEIINNIADKTRLIAFNAALEASSAGDAGKRFGVVAVEIRRLADNVVDSTTEIGGKITEILDAVNRLVMSSERTSVMMQRSQESAARTVTMLNSMVAGVEESTDSAKQISLSTKQQQIASGQVLLSIREIEQGMRQSTESARESGVVAGELARLAGRLKSLVTTFKIAPDDASTRPG